MKGPTLESHVCVRGAGRHCEDRAIALAVDSAHLLVVCDGSGGTGGGAAAAVTLTEFVASQGPSLVASKDPHVWIMALIEADKLVQEATRGGESTCVVAVVSDGYVRGASVGDSRAWIVDREGVRDLTEKQNRRPYMGAGGVTPVNFGPLPLTGRLLMGTDGLFNHARRDGIIRTTLMEPMSDVPEKLIDLARLPTGELADDATAVVCGPVERRHTPA